MEIIPVINCTDEESVIEALGKLQAFLPAGHWVHVDVADGKFTFHKTWNVPGNWRNLSQGFTLEVHLMVEEPETVVEEWLKAGAKRIIVHYEALSDQRYRATTVPPDVVMKSMRELSAKYGAEVFLGVDPATPVTSLKDQFAQFPGAQILAVNPGLPGQKFLPLVLDKVKLLRKELPNIKIEVDGGINPETAALCKMVGADMLASATYVLESADPAKAYEELTRV